MSTPPRTSDTCGTRSFIAVEERIGLRFVALVDQHFDGLEGRMDRFEGRMDDLQKQVGAFTRHLVVTVVGAVVTMVPVVFTVSHFAD